MSTPQPEFPANVDRSVPIGSEQRRSRARRIAGLVVGTVLWALAVFLAHAFPSILLGTSVAVLWAALQFPVLIPLTGGAERPDVVVNREQLGTNLSGLAAFILLAWCGSFAEEVYFRAHLMTMLRGVMGDSPMASGFVVLVPTVLFVWS